MKYRKKPVIIESVRFLGFDSGGSVVFDFNDRNEPSWIRDSFKDGKITYDSTGRLVIKTLEGDHCARVGDYIIQGVKGELYPCKPDIFELTYEVTGRDVLVSKGDVLARKVDSETAEAFEVILADEVVFVVAPVVYDENNKCYVTDYEKMQAYSNKPNINSLQMLGFIKG